MRIVDLDELPHVRVVARRLELDRAVAEQLARHGLDEPDAGHPVDPQRRLARGRLRHALHADDPLAGEDHPLGLPGLPAQEGATTPATSAKIHAIGSGCTTAASSSTQQRDRRTTCAAGGTARPSGAGCAHRTGSSEGRKAGTRLRTRACRGSCPTPCATWRDEMPRTVGDGRGLVRRGDDVEDQERDDEPAMATLTIACLLVHSGRVRARTTHLGTFIPHHFGRFRECRAVRQE